MPVGGTGERSAAANSSRRCSAVSVALAPFSFFSCVGAVRGAAAAFAGRVAFLADGAFAGAFDFRAVVVVVRVVMAPDGTEKSATIPAPVVYDGRRDLPLIVVEFPHGVEHVLTLRGPDHTTEGSPRLARQPDCYSGRVRKGPCGIVPRSLRHGEHR